MPGFEIVTFGKFARRTWFRLAVGLAFPLAAFGCQSVLQLDAHPYVCLLFYPAVFFGSWLGGLVGGATATVLSTVIGWYFFTSPFQSFVVQRPSEAISIAIFASMGILFSLAHERLRLGHRRETERDLARTQEMMRLFIEHAPLSIAMLDRDLRYLAVSRRWMTEIACGTGDLTGCSHAKIFPDLPERWKTAYRDALAGATVGSDGEQWNRADGTTIWLRWKANPWTERDGTVGGIILSAEDVTDSRLADDQKRITSTLFTHTLEGILFTDAEGTILAANPAFCAVTGYLEAELIGANPRILKSERHDQDFYVRMFETVAAVGSWQGEIWNRRKDGELFPEWLTISAVRDSAGGITNYIGSSVDISRAKETEAQIDRLANRDPLTDLPNRTAVMQSIQRAIAKARRDDSKGAILFLDLDHFKNVNDSLGHPVGDELLCAVARRYGARLRDNDILSRTGGDEFLVLLENLRDPAQAASVAQTLIDALKTPFALPGGHEIYIGTSIGISVFPDDGDVPDRVISCADAAMYQAKKGGRNSFLFYTQALTQAAHARIDLEAALRKGLDRGEFLVHYQPLVAMADLQITGVEALVRWQRPHHGLVSPGQFIPVAEETGLILPLGAEVLRMACRQMREWLDGGAPLQTMAVNLSAHQFTQPDIAEQVAGILAETGLSGRYLELEITESALMDSGEAERKLSALKTLGVRLAIDDFGTGYSSLAYLKRLPIDKLKIDQSFVHDIPNDPANMEIVAAVVAMAKNLHLTVLAEGVETEAQLAFLRDLHCDALQGYLFSRPLPARQLPVLWERSLDYAAQ
ncbi:EAL domain-containing protein [Telmatospirillum sp.]|uniref:EAL domain-containing protein n=1 Tax=Telmatospirillum sp. TaxID=2079197 RepID=UPI002846EF14|nr:EAL domain-containing protein [Telmatospirillum sp.]MDR3436780.1 EAL domain-containing protein [Telmatospirillum sp.]